MKLFREAGGEALVPVHLRRYHKPEEAAARFQKVIDSDPANPILYLLPSKTWSPRDTDERFILSIDSDRAAVSISRCIQAKCSASQTIELARVGSRLDEIFKTRAERIVYIKTGSNYSPAALRDVLQQAHRAGIDTTRLWSASGG